MRQQALFAGCFIALVIAQSSAAACALCDSETGKQVRAGIFNDQFWENLLKTLLPFPILLAIVALIYFDVGRPAQQRQTNADTAGPAPAAPSTGE